MTGIAAAAGEPATVAEAAGPSADAKAGALADWNVVATGAAGDDAAAVLLGALAAGGKDAA